MGGKQARNYETKERDGGREREREREREKGGKEGAIRPAPHGGPNLNGGPVIKILTDTNSLKTNE